MVPIIEHWVRLFAMRPYAEFVQSIRTAYEHRGGTKTLCLGALDADWFKEIQVEARSIVDGASYSDVSDKSHVTHWTRPSGQVRQFSLFNSSGNSGDYTGDYGALEDTKEKKLVFPTKLNIARFANLFGDRLRSLRLNGMGASSGLSAHEEESISTTPAGRRYIVRFHLPIFTNPKAWIYLDGERFQYQPGHLYFFNHGCVHAASNDSADTRYHFVLDCFLNRTLFDSLIDPIRPSLDNGFKKALGENRIVPSEEYRFENFVSEGGVLRTGPVDYGRRAPGPFGYWKKNYPSVFSWLGEGR